MVDIFIPNKTMKGRAVNSPGHPSHGHILLKNPSGIIGDGGIIIPGQWWTPYLGSSVLDPVPSGFTQVTLPEGARMIYLSDTGSDSNDGLTPSTPKLTPTAAASLTRQGVGDILCVERGGQTTFNFKESSVSNAIRGGVDGKPTTITWYGTGPRPRIIPPGMIRTYHSYINWIGLHFVNPYAELGNPLFDGGTTKINFGMSGSSISNWLVEDCEFTGVGRVYQSQDGSYVGNITDRRNISHYVYSANTATITSSRPSSIYSYMCDNLLIEQNVEDYGGWHPDVVAGTYNGVTITGAGANMYNHAYYIGEGNTYSGVKIFDNLVSRPSSHIAQLRSGGQAERNIGIYPSVGFALGYYNPGIPDGRVCRLEENLVLRVHTMYRNAGSCNGGMCTSAVWGLDYSAFNPNATYESIGNVVAEVAYDYIQHSSPPSVGARFKTWYHPELNGNRTFPNDPDLVVTDNDRAYHVDSSTQGDGQFVDPGRSLESYFSMLAEEPMTYDQSMNVLKSRGAYEWHSQLNNMAIHQYIMAGYDPA